MKYRCIKCGQREDEPSGEGCANPRWHVSVGESARCADCGCASAECVCDSVPFDHAFEQEGEGDSNA